MMITRVIFDRGEHDMNYGAMSHCCPLYQWIFVFTVLNSHPVCMYSVCSIWNWDKVSPCASRSDHSTQDLLKNSLFNAFEPSLQMTPSEQRTSWLITNIPRVSAYVTQCSCQDGLQRTSRWNVIRFWDGRLSWRGTTKLLHCLSKSHCLWCECSVLKSVLNSVRRYTSVLPNWYFLKQESPADAGIPARRKNDEKNSSISKL